MLPSAVWYRLLAVFALASWAVDAWANDTSAAQALTISADGATVLDTRTGLVWSRCAEGTHWNGKICQGEPVKATHAEAVALAKARAKSEGLRWRLPSVTQLRQLSSKAAKGADGGPLFFPAHAGDWYWTLTARVDTAPVNPYNYGAIMREQQAGGANRMSFLHGWAVNLQTGEARDDVTKKTPLAVLLVRPAN